MNIKEDLIPFLRKFDGDIIITFEGLAYLLKLDAGLLNATAIELGYKMSLVLSDDGCDGFRWVDGLTSGDASSFIIDVAHLDVIPDLPEEYLGTLGDIINSWTSTVGFCGFLEYVTGWSVDRTETYAELKDLFPTNNAL